MYVKYSPLNEGPGVEIQLAPGQKGTDQTVDVMRRMARGSLLDPVTKTAAVQMVRAVRPMDMDGYIRAVWQGIRDHMTFTPDVTGQEEITSPAIHSRRILSGGRSWGDCDDYATLGAAWLLALGVPARFEVVASPKNFGRFDHVRVAALSSRGWVPLETTIARVPFGGSVKTLRVKVYPV